MSLRNTSGCNESALFDRGTFRKGRENKDLSGACSCARVVVGRVFKFEISGPASFLYPPYLLFPSRCPFLLIVTPKKRTPPSRSKSGDLVLPRLDEIISRVRARAIKEREIELLYAEIIHAERARERCRVRIGRSKNALGFNGIAESLRGAARIRITTCEKRERKKEYARAKREKKEEGRRKKERQKNESESVIGR